ncbi:hypothetical protein HPB47_004244 [Ixodes persulcatus]|uniref:Uncharacterized protein n=1 Tax=Ixodes persulcatus TaxID=34615 RepID=A0AC60PG93_IXOPE|nr:hypothetical protein HPB47_004244 [Ixodes persulcatus]
MKSLLSRVQARHGRTSTLDPTWRLVGSPVAPTSPTAAEIHGPELAASPRDAPQRLERRSYAAYDLSRQTNDLQIFRGAQESGREDLPSQLNLRLDRSPKPSFRGFWERSTPLEQWLVILCMAVVIAVCIMLTYTFYYAREYSKMIELKETLNLDMSPCKNFYEYVCSLWPSRYPMPDDAGFYSARDDVRERQRKKLIPPLIKGQLEDQRFTDERSAVHLFQSCNNIRM